MVLASLVLCLVLSNLEVPALGSAVKSYHSPSPHPTSNTTNQNGASILDLCAFGIPAHARLFGSLSRQYATHTL